MMKNPKVSVVIPVYNGEETLRQCLNSVLNQTYKNYEVIVVDNNSKDKTEEIIKSFESEDKRLRYVFEKRQSVGAARNSGIKSAKGEIFVFTDCDCIAPKNWIEEITKPIIYKNEKVVLGSEKEAVSNYWTKNIQNSNLRYFKKSLKGKYIDTLDGKNFAIKRLLMKKLLFNPEIRMLDDFDLYMRLREIAKIRFLPSLKVRHYHKSSFKKLIKMNFVRGFWAARIYEKHKSEENIDEVIMFKSNSVQNNLIFPFWIILRLITKPIGEFYFILVSELSWRTGVLWKKIGGNIKNEKL